MTRGAVVIACAAALAAAGCGSDAGEIDAHGLTLLRAEVRGARLAAAQQDYTRARTLLQAVEDTVNALRDRDMVSDRRAAAILAALGETEDALRRLIPPRASTTTAAPAARPPAPATSAPSPATSAPPRGGDGHAGNDGDDGGEGKRGKGKRGRGD
jgi:hypothetical protein